VLYPAFEQYYLAGSESAPTSTEQESAIELTQLASAIIDFFSAVARGGRAREWFSPETTVVLVSTVFKYVQMTEIDVGGFTILRGTVGSLFSTGG
jgi:importin-9